MRKNLFSKAMAMLLSAGLVCTTLPVSPVSAEEAAVNAPAEQVLSLSTTTTTTTTPATEPVIDMCYSTLVEYDRTELAVGDVMEVRFWNPETGECSGGDISEVSDNISYEYEEDTGTIYITALSAGVGKMYVREYTCAFGAYVTFNVTDGQITTADSASTTTTAFTGTMTIPPAETTVATTLRTTETISPDETKLTVEIDTLESFAEADFGQSLENVYSVMFEFDNVSLSDEDRVYLRFDVDNGVDYYQVLYPMSIFSSSSTDKWWSEVQLANSFSYAIVRLPEGGWGTVSWLDVDASDVSDMLFDAVKASDKAVFEIVQSEFEDSPVFTGTTADTADTVTTYTTTVATTATTTAATVTASSTTETSVYDYTIPVGASVTVPVFDEDLTGTVETVTVDGGNTIIEITRTENLGNLINLHISALSVGEDTIRLYLDDGSEFTVSITVIEAITTSATTATTVSTLNTPDAGNTTLPTTYYSTTFPTTSHKTTTTSPYTTTTVVPETTSVTLTTASTTSVPLGTEGDVILEYDGFYYVFLNDGTIEIIDSDYPTGTSVWVVTVPETIDGVPVTSIRDGAFLGGGPRTVYLPSTITHIGENIFGPHAWEVDVYFDGTIYDWNEVEVGDWIYGIESIQIHFVNDTYKYAIKGDMTAGITGVVDTTASSVTIPAEIDGLPILRVEGYAFNNNASASEIVVSEGITSFEDHAFASCSNLTSVQLPESLECIGYCAFTCCENLTDIDIPAGVAEISDHAFSGCSSLTSITLPAGAEFGTRTFMGCESLTDVTIPEGVKAISNYMFYGCTMLLEVELPDSVEHVGYCAFDNTRWLKSKTNFGVMAVLNGFLIKGCNASGDVTIGEDIHTITGHAFYENTDITSITCLGDIKNIGENAFYGCTALESVSLGSSVKSIDDGAFMYCESLNKIDIPITVEYIDADAFFGTGITDIYYEGSRLDWAYIEGVSFLDLEDIVVHYAKETEATYGDINSDGITDLDDAVSALTIYSYNAAGISSSKITAPMKVIADADGSGTVTLDDAVKILTYYSMKAAGLQPSWADII